jgi:hypothetical protein
MARSVGGASARSLTSVERFSVVYRRVVLRADQAAAELVNGARFCANNSAGAMPSRHLSEMMERINNRLRAKISRENTEFVTGDLPVACDLFWGVAPISGENRGAHRIRA